jgi:hypothetical protein
MSNEKHLDITELIEYSKGIYSVPGADRKHYSRIVSHLANCMVCLNRLQDIRNLKGNFDKIWEDNFPLPEAEMAEQESIATANILKWIAGAKLRKELTTILEKVENLLNNGINQISDYKILFHVTTLGKPEERKLTLYFIDSLDIKLFDRIVLKDNDLIFHAGSDPGYKNICIVGPDQMHRIARIIKYGKENILRNSQMLP